MKVLIACEESQRVCSAFRARGHEAYSCDIIECSGGHPEWHIMQDVLPLINGNCTFTTIDGITHTIEGKWDLLIAHPPCTFLSNAGNGYFNVGKYGEKAIQRLRDRDDAAKFFMKFINADCDKIVVENPVGYMNTHYQKPTQIIEPYFFAESIDDVENYQRKKTCLWIKGLEPLKKLNNFDAPKPTYIDKKTGTKRYYCDALPGKTKEGKRLRSQTFKGVARAMANQWG